MKKILDFIFGFSAIIAQNALLEKEVAELKAIHDAHLNAGGL